MKTACFTGHRKIFCDIEDLKSRLYNVLERAVINAGINDFYNGGAVGWDMLTAEIVMKLREKYPQIRLHMILPCSPENQSHKWTPEQKKTYFSILEQADSIEKISENYYNSCMKQRNARLIELSDCCFCYWDGNIKSGTFQTIRMAQKKHIMIVNFCNNYPY